ncbi:MAG: hypothetical protein KAI51_02100 [Candidatus Aenigmarchaeota archaeon]|nr:hypothetical protein [Candidatus Aenigmarchaeota archaeon]MCK5452206.1 hypothetical protein [Candidatus Aenigmarchaeota archaeon]
MDKKKDTAENDINAALLKICENIYGYKNPNCVIITGETKKIEDSNIFIYSIDEGQESHTPGYLDIKNEISYMLKTKDPEQTYDLSGISFPDFIMEPLLIDKKIKIHPISNKHSDGPKMILDDSLVSELENYYKPELRKDEDTEDYIIPDETDEFEIILSFTDLNVLNNLTDEEYEKWVIEPFLQEMKTLNGNFEPYAS